MKAFFVYLFFWFFAALLFVVLRSACIIAFGLSSVTDIIVLGAADPQLVAGAISKVIVESILAGIFYTIVAYPVYFLIKKKIKYPCLLVAALLTIILCLSFDGDWVVLVIKILAAYLFVWVGLKLPNKNLGTRET